MGGACDEKNQESEKALTFLCGVRCVAEKVIFLGMYHRTTNNKALTRPKELEEHFRSLWWIFGALAAKVVMSVFSGQFGKCTGKRDRSEGFWSDMSFPPCTSTNAITDSRMNMDRFVKHPWKWSCVPRNDKYHESYV